MGNCARLKHLFTGLQLKIDFVVPSPDSSKEEPTRKSLLACTTRMSESSYDFSSAVAAVLPAAPTDGIHPSPRGLVRSLHLSKN